MSQKWKFFKAIDTQIKSILSMLLSLAPILFYPFVHWACKLMHMRKRRAWNEFISRARRQARVGRNSAARFKKTMLSCAARCYCLVLVWVMARSVASHKKTCFVKSSVDVIIYILFYFPVGWHSRPVGLL